MVSDFLPVISLPRFHICIDFVKTFLERHIEESRVYSLPVFTHSRLDLSSTASSNEPRTRLSRSGLPVMKRSESLCGNKLPPLLPVLTLCFSL